MTKYIPAVQARQRLGELLDDVRLRGAEYVIERDGEPAAAVISVEAYARFQQARTDAFGRIETLRDRLAENVSVADLDNLIDDVAAEVRAKR